MIEPIQFSFPNPNDELKRENYKNTALFRTKLHLHPSIVKNLQKYPSNPIRH